METPWVTFGAAVVGALLGSLVTAWFSRRESKLTLRIETAKGILSFLALVLNRSAPEAQAANAEVLNQEWAAHNRSLYLVSVPDTIRQQLGECIANYLKALRGMAQGSETRDEVERLRERAKTEARNFLTAMGMNAGW